MAERSNWYGAKGKGDGHKPEMTHERHARERQEMHTRHQKNP